MPDLQMLPSGYPELLENLKEHIRTSQVRAALAVSRELVFLYWSIGPDILVLPRSGPRRRSARVARFPQASTYTATQSDAG